MMADSGVTASRAAGSRAAGPLAGGVDEALAGEAVAGESVTGASVAGETATEETATEETATEETTAEKPIAGQPDVIAGQPDAGEAGLPARSGWMRGVVRRFGSVRARATLAAVAVVGAAMAVGAVGLLGLLRASMTEGVETTAAAQLNDVASLLRLGQLPAQLPAGRGDTFTQVVGPDGRVLATTATLLGTRPISALHPGEDGTVIQTIPTLSARDPDVGSDPEGPYLLLAQSFSAPLATGSLAPVSVYVAGSLRPVTQATAIVGLALAGGLPVLVLLVGGLVWIFAGRALRPVEAIRAEVADISGHDLHRRVPQPGSTDEVARLARTMNEMLDRLESSAVAQRRFVADASHELRSPLAVLQATLEVALAHPNDSAWPAVAADALDEAGRLHRLVEDLLVLARAEQAAPAPRTEAVDLDEVVLREARLWRGTGSAVPLDLRRVSAGRVHGDPDQLARVVHNLVDNAQRHATGSVSVELATTRDRVVLVVADDGPGIAPEHRSQIFERFARIDEARSEDDGGTGLGLAIAKESVVAHGGTIEIVDSAVGARFVVRLPAAETSDQDPAPVVPAVLPTATVARSTDIVRRSRPGRR